jgi:hypothetical protein
MLAWIAARCLDTSRQRPSAIVAMIFSKLNRSIRSRCLAHRNQPRVRQAARSATLCAPTRRYQRRVGTCHQPTRDQLMTDFQIPRICPRLPPWRIMHTRRMKPCHHVIKPRPAGRRPGRSRNGPRRWNIGECKKLADAPPLEISRNQGRLLRPRRLLPRNHRRPAWPLVLRAQQRQWLPALGQWAPIAAGSMGGRARACARNALRTAAAAG